MSAPLLIVVAGAGRGRSVAVADPVTIGRGDENTLAIGDPALSRRHCVVTLDASGLLIRDLDSKNGVFVNGMPVTARALTDGDQIRIGDSALLLVWPQRDATPPPVAFVDTPLPAAATVSIEAAASRYLRAEDARRDDGAAADLRRLLGLSRDLQRAGDRAALHEALLSHVLDRFGADTAALVAAGEGEADVTVIAARTRGSQEVPVNRVLAARTFGDGRAVLTDTLPAMCAPLAVEDGTAAVFVARGGPARFSENDLQVLAAIGSIGGLALDRIGHVEWLTGENRRLRSSADIDHDLVGESAPMQAVYRFIARLAATDTTVLLRGESGTGKELVASAIHRNSPRAAGPFVTINCAALPDALLESELFGHERGAFTGAVAQQRGRLELAHGGTVFLDEIGELALPLQAKLLRVLENQVVERIGARRGVKIDIRVVAATNRNLEAAIESGQFREDLYFRLNVVSLVMPPLRERREDLPLLAAYFVRQHAARCKRDVKGIAPDARRLLLGYDWPGNVRELSNALERAVVLGSGDVIQCDDLPETLIEASGDGEDNGFHAQVARVKRDIIRQALARSSGNVAQAARDLRLQPTYLHRLIRMLEVEKPR